MTPELETAFGIYSDVARKHVQRVMIDLSSEVDILMVVTPATRPQILGAIMLSCMREFAFLAEAAEIAERGKTTATRTVVEGLLNIMSAAGRREKLINDIKETLDGIETARSDHGGSQNVHPGWRKDQGDRG